MAEGFNNCGSPGDVRSPASLGYIYPKLTAHELVSLVQAHILTHEVALAYLQKHYLVPELPTFEFPVVK